MPSSSPCIQHDLRACPLLIGPIFAFYEIRAAIVAIPTICVALSFQSVLSTQANLVSTEAAPADAAPLHELQRSGTCVCDPRIRPTSGSARSLKVDYHVSCGGRLAMRSVLLMLRKRSETFAWAASSTRGFSGACKHVAVYRHRIY